jgi:3-phenylpropionate/trans-cinnamate dioxygenase ferredoxin reductase subunit
MCSELVREKRNLESLDKPGDQSSERIVIVGAGQAGCTIALELRKLGYSGGICLIGMETHLPYQRPPLSKAYLSGEADIQKLLLITERRMQDANIDFIRETQVLKIHRDKKTLTIADGRSLAYDRLALTTGGICRTLPLHGSDGENVFSLRNLNDADQIRNHWEPGAKLVIIGGGFIGLEVAAKAVSAGLRVTVIEGLPQILSRVTIPKVSKFFESIHRAAGVNLITSGKIEKLVGAPRVTHVRLEDGTMIESDFILVGIGLLPNIDLAKSAGIECQDGILVDQFTRTSDPAIVAAGDCTNHPSAYAKRRLRLESVQNAVDQARIAAATLCGQAKPYNTVPWFWSDQYDIKLQVAGLSTGHDEWVLRGNPEGRSFSVFYLQSGRLIAADSINRMQDHMLARRLIADGAKLDSQILADESVSIKDALVTMQ